MLLLSKDWEIFAPKSNRTLFFCSVLTHRKFKYIALFPHSLSVVIQELLKKELIL